jgi:dolichol kinase
VKPDQQAHRPHPNHLHLPTSAREARDEFQRRFRDLRHQAQDMVDHYVPQEIQKEAHRKGFHMTAGILATPLVLYGGFLFTTLAALACLIVIVAIELLQARYRVAIPVLTSQLLSTRRPGERFSWAATTFIIAALPILWIAPTPVALAALAMLGLGDGMSAMVGKMIGKHKLWYNPDKSWEGSLAGFLGGAIGALLVTAWYYAESPLEYPMLAIVPVSIAGALAAAIVESLPQWEDNVSVPLVSAGTMMLLWFTTGLQPTVGPIFDLIIEWAPFL